MQEFIEFLERLDKVEKANNPKEREHKTAGACKAMARVPQYDAKKFDQAAMLPFLENILKPYAAIYGEWVQEIPALLFSTKHEEKKKLRKRLNDLTHLVYLASCLDFETEAELLKRIQHAKSVKELDALEKGRVIQGKQIPSLKERLQAACKRNEHVVSDVMTRRFDSEKKAKRRYLERKQRADKIATRLAATLSSLGVGLVSGIAMVLIMPLLWPAIPIGGFIGAFLGFTFFGSFTEFFVYRGYVQTFCRQCVRGFFNSIDNHIYNREASKHLKLKHATKYDLSDLDKKQLRKQFRGERIAKRILILCCIPLALGAGIGFMGLVFSQVVAVLPLLGILAGGIYIAAPLAILTAPLFAFMMYGMLFKAVKNNIVGQMWNRFLKAILYEAPKDHPELTFGKLTLLQKILHVAAAFGKVVGGLSVLGISFFATAFTAQAWLESSINFCAFLGRTVAHYIGSAVGIVFLGVNYFFSVDKGLKTMSALFVPFVKLGAGVGHGVKEMFKHPGAFFKAGCVGLFRGIKHVVLHPLDTLAWCLEKFINLFCLCVHLSGTSAVATQGTEAFALEKWVGSDPLVNKFLAGATEFTEEAMVDLYDVVLHDLVEHHHAHPKFPHFYHYDHHKHKHDHEHGNLWRMGKKGVESLLRQLGMFAKPAKDSVTPTPLVTVGMRRG
jgi:hypothetical protein